MSITAIKERPILFSSPMVNAIREKRKWMTRRIVKGPLPLIHDLGDHCGPLPEPPAPNAEKEATK